MILNPSSPLDPSNPTGALNLQIHDDPRNRRDPFNPRGVATPQSPGLTGTPFYQTVPITSEPKLVFLIMSFQGDGMTEVLATVKDECTKLRLKATSSNDVVGSDFVIKKIAELIERAWLIVCDLTHERPNVYYELGYAHGVGNTGDNILLIARERTTLHFDIGTLKVNHYSSMESLRAILRKNLPEMHRLTTLKQASKKDEESHGADSSESGSRLSD